MTVRSTGAVFALGAAVGTSVGGSMVAVGATVGTSAVAAVGVAVDITACVTAAVWVVGRAEQADTDKKTVNIHIFRNLERFIFLRYLSFYSLLIEISSPIL
jgi:hypothetical protein